MKNNKQCNFKLCNILLGDRVIQYILTRSSRKTIGISIEKNGLVKVTSPYGVTESYINQLLQNKANWILKKLTTIENKVIKTNKAKVFEEGECFSYLGKEYTLKLDRRSDLEKPIVRLEAQYLVITLPSSFDIEKVKNILKLWYVDQFKLIIQDIVNQYTSTLGVFPKKITVREQKTRWGSCSAKGNINLNWKLIMAPTQVLEYVIIHELCHLREMNHSKEFWKLVEYILPQHKKYRAWLKENGDLLSIE